MKENKETEPQVFIIDEASMVGDIHTSSDAFTTPGSLLSDIIRFAKSGNKANKIIFIGDEYQLQPWNSTISPALCPEYLFKNKHLLGTMAALTEVKRQEADSYILQNATKLREHIEFGTPFTPLKYNMLSNSTQALNKYLELYQPECFDKVILIACSNKDVNWFNDKIRQRLNRHNTLDIGDEVTVNKNWQGQQRYIVKADVGIIRQILSRETYANLTFIKAEIEFKDGQNQPYSITSLILAESLTCTDGNLPPEDESYLIHETMRLNETYRASRKPEDCPYISAMRLRYAYASTCHKAQGSEWQHVIQHPFYSKNDYRWLYTAITRASKEIYTY